MSEIKLRRLIPLDGALRLIDYRLPEKGAGGRLQATVLDNSKSKGSKTRKFPGVRKELIKQTRFIFGLDDDLKSCYAVFRRFPRIHRLSKRYRGLRIVKTPNLYESLLITILGQQVSVSAAQSQRKRLMQALGETIVFQGQPHLGVPAPERLVEAGEAGLRKLGISRQKSRYLVEIAQRTADGRISSSALEGMSCKEAMERLMETPGIGRWTAEIAAMRGIGFPDVFPAGDLGLQVAAQKVFDLPDRPSENQLRDLAVEWEGWRSYAAFYLWMTLMEGGYA
jgi:DNA-3-methyladenine glycosylase II